MQTIRQISTYFFKKAKEKALRWRLFKARVDITTTLNPNTDNTRKKTGPGKPEPVIDQFIKFVLITKLSLII